MKDIFVYFHILPFYCLKYCILLSEARSEKNLVRNTSVRKPIRKVFLVGGKKVLKVKAYNVNLKKLVVNNTLK